MKKNPLVSVLLTALAVMAGFILFFTWQYNSSLAELEGLQGQRKDLDRNISAFQSLVSDTMELSQKTPALDAALQAIGLKAVPAAPAAALTNSSSK